MSKKINFSIWKQCLVNIIEFGIFPVVWLMSRHFLIQSIIFYYLVQFGVRDKMKFFSNQYQPCRQIRVLIGAINKILISIVAVKCFVFEGCSKNVK